MSAKSHLVALVGAALMIIGSFLPWVTVLGVSTSGGSSSIVMVVIAVLIGLFAFLNKMWSRVIAIILELLMVWWAVKQISDVSSFGGSASIGIGIIIIVVGAVVALLGTLLQFKSPSVSPSAA